MTSDYDASPTSGDITAHFWEHFNELSAKGNKFAQAVSDVTYSDGTVSVFIDPAKAKAERFALYSLMPMPWQRWAGTPVSFWNDKEIWLRTVVHSVRVEDVNGKVLGSASTEQLSANNHIDNIRGE